MNAFKGFARIAMVFVLVVATCYSMPTVAEDAMTNDDVVYLVSAGLGDDVIIAKIETTETDFDTSVDALLALADKGVSNAVVAAMMASGEDSASSPTTRAPAPSPDVGDSPLSRVFRNLPDSPFIRGLTLSVGSIFSDSLRRGGEGPQMVVIPAGRFHMGCVVNDGNCGREQMPAHEVVIAYDFAMSVHEITFADWDTCYSMGGCRRYRPKDRWGRYNQPVNYVSWEDAKAYVAWLSQSTGEQYRLPTEAEWEYAARAGSSELYGWGSTPSNGQANCRGCGSRFDDDATAPVGSFPPNAFGLHDMHGNLWEWVEDCWNDSYDNAPIDGSAWMRGQCSKRILRGGAWSSNQLTLRSSYRSSDEANGRGSGRGFRVARSLR